MFSVWSHYLDASTTTKSYGVLRLSKCVNGQATTSTNKTLVYFFFFSLIHFLQEWNHRLHLFALLHLDDIFTSRVIIHFSQPDG